MTPNEFARLSAQGFTRIPLHCEVVADFENPLSTFVKLANQPFSFLLESVQGGEKWSRFSIIGLPCSTIIRVHAHHISVDRNGDIESFEHADPLSWIDEYQQQFSIPDIEGLPKVTGGLVGYFGYDTVRLIEPRLGPNTHPDPLGNPDILLMEANELVVFDNLSGKLNLLVLVDPKTDNAYENGVARLSGLLKQLHEPIPEQPSQCVATQLAESDFKSSFTETGYKKAVETIRQYIKDGECMQVVLSQRMSVPFEAAPLDLYRALRMLNPSPYMFYLNLGDHQVVGASPEILVRLEDGEVTVRPLAGTRPRGASNEADLENEKSLMADPKELAEHLMLIDLGRNDIGRIAQTGSVEVTDKFSIERYSHVMHIVSNVVGKLNEGMSSLDVLRATFPAGTLSGAPKVRALEILQELEVVKRGIYSGAVGYLSWNGNMDTSIAIRTAVIQNGELHVQAGAGIVYDSDPDAEWAETMSKARAIIKAVALAHDGLNTVPAFLSDQSLSDQSLSNKSLSNQTGTQDQEASS